MEQLVSHLLSILGGVPAPLVYLIAAVWVGFESAGIGVPIEPMMLFVGSLAARANLGQSAAGHQVNFFLAVLATALGCVAFSALAYTIGRSVGTAEIARVGRFVGLNQQRADHIELWLRHRGAAGVFIARITPIVRTFGSFIMGAAELPLPTFVLGTFVGSLVYCGAWIFAGVQLGANYPALLHTFDQYKGVGVALVVGIIAVVVVLHHFAGRLTLRRMAAHFHLHHAQHTVAATAPSSLSS